jgi:hypothetical protein
MKRSPLQRRKRLVSKTTLKMRNPMKRVRETPRRKSKPKRREWLKVYEGGREVLDIRTALGLREYKARTYAMADRQGWLCAYCRLGMSEKDVTFDHERLRGVSRQDDRIWLPATEGEMPKPINHALHGVCNQLRGSKRVEMPYFAADIQMPTI